jgi:hypothetical protein
MGTDREDGWMGRNKRKNLDELPAKHRLEFVSYITSGRKSIGYPPLCPLPLAGNTHDVRIS